MTAHDLLRESAAIVAEMMSPEGIDADELDARVAAWLDAQEDRVAACRAVVIRIDAEDELYAQLAAQVRQARARLSRQRDHVRSRATALLEERERLTGDARVRGVGYAAWLQSSESVDISGADVGLLPDALRRVHVEPDRAAIAAAIRAGDDVPGCTLRTTRSVRWR